MFAAQRYISWSRKYYGNVPFDLATSGIPQVTWGEVGAKHPDIEDPTAHARFREAIALYNDVATAEVVPALGTTQAIFLAYSAILQPGDEVLLEHPVYEPLRAVANALGAVTTFFERRGDESFAIVPSRVASVMTPRTRVVAITNLHNPTGVRTTPEALRELAQLANARGATLLVDEVYAPFDSLPEDGVFRGSARKLAPNIVAIGSLTKCYGVGPHRVGWLLGPPHVTQKAEHALVATVGHLPLAHAARGAVLLGNVGRLAERASSLFQGKRQLVEQWVSSLPRTRWSSPREGLFGLLTLEGAHDLLPRIESWATNEGVLVAAGSFFGVDDALRLSWATLPRDRLEQGLEKLGTLLR